MRRGSGAVVRRTSEGCPAPWSSGSGQTSGIARSSRRSRIVAGDGFESPASLLPGDQMTGRMGEMLTGIAGELGAEEWGHQGDRGKAREWKESHADVLFAARNVSGFVGHGELGIQVDEEVEHDFVSRHAFQGIEVLVDVHQLLGFDVESGLLVDFAAHALRETLSEFEMASGECVTLASSAIVRLLGENGLIVDQDAAGADEEFSRRIMRSEHRALPPSPGGAG